MAMKIEKKNRRITLYLGLIILLISGVFVATWLVLNMNNEATTPHSKDGVDYNQATSEQIDTGKRIKEDSLNSNSDTTSPPSPSSTSQKDSVDIQITATNQISSILQIRTSIASLVTEGTCTLTLQKQAAQETVTKTAGVSATANISTCNGFDVPTSELSTGSWDITLLFENSILTGKTEKEITIN